MVREMIAITAVDLQKNSIFQYKRSSYYVIRTLSVFDIHMSVHRKYNSKLKTNKMQRFLIYLLLQTLYMFQAVPSHIIRST